MPPDDADPPFAQLRVLVLDDDHLLLEVMREMLDACGPCEIVLELDARQALARLDEAMPDVLICDLVLPEMDGIEFLQAAASLGYAGRVILLSALEDEVREAAAELARALGLRVVGSFRKPLMPEQLRHALEC
ncbi:response regulator [Massilia timonae]|uniref:Response regulator n=1 Tax=Massilia timonae TaxID=47229 RepID=A0A1S2NHA4_9BURK|nr:response regulator [Massilia timonae]OIJ44476.1 response regulator [Massilia timonae]